ncbi:MULTISPECIES: ABC transporter substrate-binding protein [unclassified Saccharopolyspora]|uniref:ABC transporter substrate-binding protein n=1 Tax=unclassified Saccharopolyspora TaxID=2646250 RepID=UPI001CD815AD|nr:MULTISPECIES: ABC transporter substrate-binding protein [unclassified Saccharopolyspora]MCA1185384.1 ABC transporter substrate-binding protein [Saccharopolyspora sp. 6T]MCA1194206.1 ABC transporter substrate-binding protein [Saccharopolyspora sp. 6V]MCA1224722.1 ABC transporter substrate-binding protein [Saccharopolyspora sp. 6M]MCA1279351.1 ABC transporter substrate-binding protein [Saccharopolyspora sp. 7B]
MSFEQPPRPRWGLRIALAAGSALVLVLGVVTVVWAVAPCDSGMSHVRGECVGVTDGSEVFSPELEDVERRIAAENDRVADDDFVVTVAVLMPMTAGEDDSLSISQIRSYLQGAHVAQVNANQDRRGLKVRLALANEGRYEHAWKEVTERLVDMVEPENLVAVTGLGLSSPETALGARELAAAGIPMVGYLSADRFNSLPGEHGPAIAGLHRVSPSIEQELGTIAEHLDELVGPQPTALLVRDGNGDDIYTADLRENFQEKFGAAWQRSGRTTGSYTGGPDAFGLGTQFEYIADRICTSEVNVVLYAGRSNLLPDFVEKVRRRGCDPHRHITIITGSESTDLHLSADPGTAPVSVLYASVADPAALADARNQDRPLYTAFTGALHRLFDADAPVSNWSVLGHDATLAAVTAAQHAVGRHPGVPTTNGVLAHLRLLNHETNSVAGASGRFTFDSDSGDRVSGSIPVLRRSGDGQVEVVVPGGDAG